MIRQTFKRTQPGREAAERVQRNWLKKSQQAARANRMVLSRAEGIVPPSSEMGPEWDPERDRHARS